MNIENDYLDIENYYINNTKSACLSVTIECQLFEKINHGFNTLESLVFNFSYNEKVLKGFIEALESLQFLTIDSGRIQTTNKTNNFFLISSSFYQGEDILRKKIESQHNRFKSALLSGRPTLNYSGTPMTSMWESANIDDDSAKYFTKLMHQMMSYPAYKHVQSGVFNHLNNIIDVGGGSGAWASQLLKQNKAIKITIFDLQNVLDTAKEILRSENFLSENILFEAGNFFDSIPKGENYLLSNILHDWPMEKCKIILKNIYNVMSSSGTLYINECLLNEDRKGPEFTSLFNLLMSVNHGAQQFSYGELKNLLSDIGFENLAIVSQAGSYSLLECKKAAKEKSF